MKVTFQILISTFKDNNSVTLSSGNKFKDGSVFNLISTKYLSGSKNSNIVSDSLIFENRWCFFVCYPEKGTTTVRGEIRKYDEIRVAISDDFLEGQPTQKITSEVNRLLDNLEVFSDGKIPPLAIDLPCKIAKEKNKIMKSNHYLLYAFSAIVVVGTIVSGLLVAKNSIAKKNKNILRKNNEQKATIQKKLLPFEMTNPVSYNKIVAFLQKRIPNYNSILNLSAKRILENLRKQNYDSKKENKRIQHIITYSFWKKLLAFVYPERRIRNQINIDFITNKNKSSDNLYQQFNGFNFKKLDSDGSESLKNIIKNNTTWSYSNIPKKEFSAVFFPTKGDENGFSFYVNDAKSWQDVFQQIDSINCKNWSDIQNIKENSLKKIFEIISKELSSK